MINNNLIEMIKINDEVFKVGNYANVNYDYISRISAVQASVKDNVVIVNIYHRISEMLSDKGELVEIPGKKEYMLKTIINPGNVEIRYKKTALFEEQAMLRKELNKRTKLEPKTTKITPIRSEIKNTC